MTILEDDPALTEYAAIGAIRPGYAIGVHGPDRASFLHGLLTNDITALAPGAGCYAAWLTPQGRMITDLHVFAQPEMILLDVPAELGPAIFQRLDQSLFSEDVRLEDLSQTRTAIWLHGPSAAPIVETTINGISGLGSWAEYHHEAGRFGESTVFVARVSQLGVPGFSLYVNTARAADLRHALEAAGAVPIGREAIDAARIEAGYPLLGVDMTNETIPLEAGIADRAISFTKGCYVGQEVIVRVLHRGHGRIVRRLVGLRIDGAVPPGGAAIRSGDREIGWITSAADSPRLGAIALGYVHRDFVNPGTRVDVDGQRATVTQLPMTADR